MEEKFPRKGKNKSNLKQKQHESISFWKEHSETMLLNETQFPTKIFSVLQELLLCCAYQEACVFFPKRDNVLYFMLVPLFVSSPHLLQFKLSIVVLYLQSALNIWKVLSLQELKKKKIGPQVWQQ